MTPLAWLKTWLGPQPTLKQGGGPERFSRSKRILPLFLANLKRPAYCCTAPWSTLNRKGTRMTPGMLSAKKPYWTVYLATWRGVMSERRSLLITEEQSLEMLFRRLLWR